MTNDQLVRGLRDAIEASVAPDDSAVERLVVDRTGEEVAAALRSLVPVARARHRRLGLSDSMSEETLADIERKHQLYGADTVSAWLVGILRGDVVQVGRLQVELRSGERGHALHIPETGSLAPERVSDALVQARALTRSARFTCSSWLLDRQLAATLPDTNIAAFARRFDIVEEDEEEDGDEAVAKFVFRLKPAQVLAGAITPRTRLEHFVVDRLRSGPRWTQPLGVLDDETG